MQVNARSPTNLTRGCRWTIAIAEMDGWLHHPYEPQR